MNPNRVHLFTELAIDEGWNSTMAVSAEYMLKQTKLNFSLDSNLILKSAVDVTVQPGINIGLNSEISHLNSGAPEAYKFGSSITMM